MSTPDKCLIRWGELVAWCGAEGISERQVRRHVRSGRITRLRPPGCVRGYYSVSQVYKLIHGKRLNSPVICWTQEV